jgi:tRNA(fMet)-specific endonuclease VapC
MGYLLDTCVISDFTYGEANTLKRLRATPPSEVFISSITVMELSYGLMLNPAKAVKLRPLIDALLDTLTILNFDPDVAMHAAQIRSVLKAKGTPISAYDVLIGATGLTHNLITVTANVREFQRIPNFSIENWRQPAEPQTS